MTGITNISAPIASAIPAQAPVLPSAPVVAAAAPAVVASSAPNTPSRFEADPLSGVVVTQFFDNSGEIITQVPSKAVVAYLQNGLTPDGFAKSSQTSVA